MIRRFLAAIVAILSIAMGLGLNASAASAAPNSWDWGTTTAATASVTPSPYFTETRYRDKSICIHQMFTSTAWAPGDIGNALEPAIVTGWRSASQGCGDYYGWQVMRVALYSADDGHCTKSTGTTNPANIYIGHPMNQWYDTVWTNEVSYPTVWINQFYNNTCWADGSQYYLSREMETVVGLEGGFSLCGASYTSPRNSCEPSDFPTVFDRNQLTQLMNP